MENFFDEFYRDADTRPSYVAAGVCLELAKNIEDLMAGMELNNTELAERLNCSKANVTKLLRGDANLTIKTLAKIAIALDAELKSVLIPKSGYAVFDAKVKAFLSYDKKVKFNEPRREDRTWIASFKGCNDENYARSADTNWEIENAYPRSACS
jgi:transcriptional regulator with XRE-family HTH domain